MERQASWLEVRRGKVWTYQVRASGALLDWEALHLGQLVRERWGHQEP